MAWKKLAFTDEMLTNPMTADLDMDSNDINNVVTVNAPLSTGKLELHGGISSNDPIIDLYGKDNAGASKGQIVFRVPNAAGSATLIAGAFMGRTDSPELSLNYGLNMNDSNIEDMCALKAHDALGIAVFDSGDSDRLVLCPTGYGFLTNAPVDMNKQEIEAMCFENLASAPAAPGVAQIYYDTVDDHLYVNVV